MMNLKELSEQTTGYSGAEIESIIQETIERAFLAHQEQIQTQDLLKTLEEMDAQSYLWEEQRKEIKMILSELEVRMTSEIEEE